MSQNSDSPLVSVVLPTFNNANTIRAAVGSIIRQTQRDWELLVIDDGSTDDTPAAIDEFGDERIKLVRDGARRGLPARLNQAMAMARGVFIARMDGDDFSYPERLTWQLDYLSAHSDVDLVSGWALFFNHPDRPIGLLKSPEHHASICAKMPRIVPLVHPTWFGRRAWFLKYPYDPSFKRIEDQELLYRAMPSSRYACLQKTVLAFRLSRGHIRRVKNEAIDQWYHLLLQARYLLQEKRPLEVPFHVLSRGLKALYKPAGSFMGLHAVLHRRSLTRLTEDDIRRFRELC